MDIVTSSKVLCKPELNVRVSESITALRTPAFCSGKYDNMHTIIYVRSGGLRAVVIFVIRAETSSGCNVRHNKLAAEDRFPPAAQRGD
jgi:hypothetical protein